MILEVEKWKHQIALCGKLALEEAMDLSKDGLLNNDDVVFLCFRPTCSVYER
jgi:hypothetical protein